jgi:hypothetical protein
MFLVCFLRGLLTNHGAPLTLQAIRSNPVRPLLSQFLDRFPNLTHTILALRGPDVHCTGGGPCREGFRAEDRFADGASDGPGRLRREELLCVGRGTPLKVGVALA